MTNEKRLIPCGKKCTLDKLLPGTIFAFGDDCIAVKSEYRCANGLIEAFIINSGEQFWGGAETVREQIALMVQPLEIEEVVHGRWEDMWDGKYANPRYRCSVCKEKANYKSVQDELLSWHDVQVLTPYCPYCLAKLDGGIDNDIKTV